MKIHRLPRPDLHPAALAGRVNGRDMHDADGKLAFAKGRVFTVDDLEPLRALEWSELHLIEPERGDVHEEEAGSRIARAVAGEGVEVGPLGGGAWPLLARARGILEVDVEQLRAIDSLDGLAVYSLLSGQVVTEGEVVGKTKVVPLVVPGIAVEAAEGLASESAGVFRVRPFRPMRVAAVVQETLPEAKRARVKDLLTEKLAWFGSELIGPVHAEPSDEALAAAVEEVLRAGAEAIVMAGSKAMDPLDPAFGALRRVGAELVRHGVPVFPGSLLWLARIGEVPVLGMPNCGAFPQPTAFDVVLARVQTGERVGPAEVAALGHGGMITRDLSFRLPPYRPGAARGAIPAEE